LAEADEFVKEFVDIGQVKITREDQVARDPVVEPYERVAGFYRIVAMGAVAEVSHEDFTGIGLIFLEPGSVTELLGGAVFKMLEDTLEDFLEVLGAVASLTADIPGTR
jgi:hypothetical protein